ncbi:hypothetical protein E3P91_00917 [Wallemia ichthyophaga]|nr:hypothetical protein E3P91_00917 [Wallemia ichthyophaga]TIA82927.1 hypothetical protein E3P98_01124 [Wallemia ichthyophaga]
MSSQETSSLLAWINSYEDVLDGNSVTEITQLSDGLVLSRILNKVLVVMSQRVSSNEKCSDPEAFPAPQKKETDSTFTTKLQSLTRLQASLTCLLPNLPPLNLSVIASTAAENEVVQLVKHALIAAVKGAGGPSVVQGIGQLGEDVGAGLMLAITPVMTRLDEPTVDNSDYYALLSTHTALTHDKKSIETAYKQLLDDMRSLRAEHDDTIAELAGLRDEAVDHQPSPISSRAEESLRNELVRVKDELQRSEDSLAESEATSERHTLTIRDLHRKMDDLSAKAAETSTLRDQLEENKHAASQLQKTENVIEKYKQKLEESASLRRQFKSLEDQNARLVDVNASLEANAKQLNATKSLADNYKTQFVDLENRHAQRMKEHQHLSHELTQLRLSHSALEEEKLRASEHVYLLEEKLKEMEADKTHADTHEILSKQTQHSHEKNSDDLELALSDTSTTDLKLQVRRLVKELESVRSDKGTDPDRALVLENVLADTQKMKERYEADWMSELTEKLDLQRKMDEIRRGMDEGSGDGPEVVTALRQRLNESTDQLDRIKSSFAELQSVHNGVTEELTRAKSDMTLVSKDQIDILNSLRQSVDEDKLEMGKENDSLKETVRRMEQHEKETLEKMNRMLMERVDEGSLGAHNRGMTESDKDYMSSLMGDLHKPHSRETELSERVNKAESQVHALTLAMDDMKKRHLKRRQEMFLNHSKVASMMDDEPASDRPPQKHSWLGMQRANLDGSLSP